MSEHRDQESGRSRLYVTTEMRDRARRSAAQYCQDLPDPAGELATLLDALGLLPSQESSWLLEDQVSPVIDISSLHVPDIRRSEMVDEL